jgi:hypothetical protein
VEFKRLDTTDVYVGFVCDDDSCSNNKEVFVSVDSLASGGTPDCEICEDEMTAEFVNIEFENDKSANQEKDINITVNVGDAVPMTLYRELEAQCRHLINRVKEQERIIANINTSERIAKIVTPPEKEIITP